jgi:Xaa-Pro aminopeptidase
MIVSNEPGYYEEGFYGIRIENLIIVQEKDGLYCFENLTMCPYDLNLIETSLLN